MCNAHKYILISLFFFFQSDIEEELEVVSAIPLDVPLEWDSDTSHLYKYRITQRTTLHFLARKYRLVFCLDLSPSTSVVDVTKGCVVLDEVFITLRKCLKGIVRPFYVPGETRYLLNSVIVLKARPFYACNLYLRRVIAHFVVYFQMIPRNFAFSVTVFGSTRDI